MKFHKNAKIITDKRIAERCYGNLQGHAHLELVKKQGFKQYDLWHRGYTNKPPKGESLKDVESRVLPFIQDILKRMKKENINIAVSAHGNSMRAFRRYFENLSIEKMCTLYNDYETVHEYKIKV
jgi:2,3-bisphosphoglycerate-dependent phosphoglycerate mutase